LVCGRAVGGGAREASRRATPTNPFLIPRGLAAGFFICSRTLRRALCKAAFFRKGGIHFAPPDAPLMAWEYRNLFGQGVALITTRHWMDFLLFPPMKRLASVIWSNCGGPNNLCALSAGDAALRLGVPTGTCFPAPCAADRSRWPREQFLRVQGSLFVFGFMPHGN